MAAEGDFELLKAFVTTKVDETSFRTAVRRLTALSKLQDKLTSAPWRIAVEVAGDLDTTRTKLEQIKAAVKEIPRRKVPVSIGLRTPRLKQELDQAIGSVDTAPVKVRFRVPPGLDTGLLKQMEAVENHAVAMGENIGKKFSAKLRSEFAKGIPETMRWFQTAMSRYRATLSGPKIKLDPEQRQFMQQIERANKARQRADAARTDAQKRAARSFDSWMEKLEKQAENRRLARSRRLAQVEARKSGVLEQRALIDKLRAQAASAMAGGGTMPGLRRLLADIEKAGTGATRRQREQLATVKEDVRQLIRELQREVSMTAARRQRISAIPAKLVAYQERKAAKQREAYGKAFEESVKNAERIRKNEIAALRRHYNSQQEVISKGLFEVRRNLHGFGIVSRVLSRNLTRDQLRFADANRRLRAALAGGDITQIRAAGREMDAMAARTRMFSMALSNAQLAIGAFKVALGGVKAAAGFVIGAMGRLIGAIAGLATATIRAGLGVLSLGLRALLAPTLALISAFRRMASYLPLIFGYGLIRWVQDAVSTFSEFEAQIARGAGQLGLFGERGADAMERLSTGARQVARTWLISQTEIAQGIEELARGGITAGIKDTKRMVDVILAELENAAAIRLATGLDIQETSKELIILRAQFGSIGKEADDAADSIIAMQAMAPVTAVDIRRFFEAAGAAGRNARISFEDLGAAGTKMMQSVASGSRAGTALSRALMILIDPPKKAAKAIKDLGLVMPSFLDASRQAFNEDGIIRFTEAIDLAKAGLADLSRIFGFRARDAANLFNFDTTRLRKSSEDVRDFSLEILDAQKRLGTAAKRAFAGRNLFDVRAGVSEARASISDLLGAISAKRTANLELFDLGNLQDARQSVRDIADEIRSAQRTNMAKAFATLIRDKTLFGTISSLKVELEELKLSFSETFMVTISSVLAGVRRVVTAISQWVRTSGAVQTIQLVILRTMDRLKRSVLPIVSKFARLSVIINAGLISAVVHLVEILATKLKPVLDRIATKIEMALGLPAGTLDSWNAAADAVAFVMNNIDHIVTIAVANIKIKMAEIGTALIGVLDPAGKGGGMVRNALAKMLSAALDAFTTMGIFLAETLVAAIDLAARTIGPAIIRAMQNRGPQAKLVDFLMVNLAGYTKEEVAQLRRMMDGIDSGNTLALRDFADRMMLAASRAAGSFSKGLEDNLARPLKEQLIIAQEGLDAVANAARKTKQEAMGMFEGIQDNKIDELRDVTKKLNALDLRAKETYRKVSGEISATIKSDIGSIEEFQKLLQQGDVQQDMLNEMRSGNQNTAGIYRILSQMREEQLGRNPNAVGAGAGQALFGAR